MVDQFLWFVNEYGFWYLLAGFFLYFLATVLHGAVSLSMEIVSGFVYMLFWPIILIMGLAVWFRKRAHIE